MEEKDSCDGCLKKNIGEVIDALALSDLQKRFLRSKRLPSGILPWMDLTTTGGRLLSRPRSMIKR